MQMASILPQNFLGLTEQSLFHMSLAHLVGEKGYEVYTDFFKNRREGAFCILDNGVIEGNPMPIETIIEKALLIKANEIVLPDAYKDASKTIKMVDHAIRVLRERFGDHKWPFQLMVVPQGESKEVWLDCAKLLITEYGEYIDTIGIPKHLIDTIGKRDARLYAISDLAELVDLEGFSIHLLGCWKTPLEVLMIAKASEQQLIPTVRSCDSAIPYVYARNGLRFSDDDRPDQDPIDFEKGHCNELLLAYNVVAWACVGDPNAERGVYFL